MGRLLRAGAVELSMRQEMSSWCFGYNNEISKIPDVTCTERLIRRLDTIVEKGG
jgi:hypothetical protein